jgi:hypothetical protein
LPRLDDAKSSDRARNCQRECTVSSAGPGSFPCDLCVLCRGAVSQSDVNEAPPSRRSLGRSHSPPRLVVVGRCFRTKPTPLAPFGDRFRREKREREREGVCARERGPCPRALRQRLSSSAPPSSRTRRRAFLSLAVSLGAASSPPRRSGGAWTATAAPLARRRRSRSGWRRAAAAAARAPGPFAAAAAPRPGLSCFSLSCSLASSVLLPPPCSPPRTGATTPTPRSGAPPSPRASACASPTPGTAPPKWRATPPPTAAATPRLFCAPTGRALPRGRAGKRPRRRRARTPAPPWRAPRSWTTTTPACPSTAPFTKTRRPAPSRRRPPPSRCTPLASRSSSACTATLPPSRPPSSLGARTTSGSSPSLGRRSGPYA